MFAGSSRRVRRAWRGGRKSNVDGGGKVEREVVSIGGAAAGVGGLVAVGIVFCGYRIS